MIEADDDYFDAWLYNDTGVDPPDMVPPPTWSDEEEVSER